MTQVPPLLGEYEILADALEAARDQFADREAYVDGEQRVTFAEWLDSANRLAGALSARGVESGDVVALMLPPCIDFAVCFAAITKVGAVVTALNTRLGPREVDAIIERAEPKLVIRDDCIPLPPVPDDLPVFWRADLAALTSRSASRSKPVRREPNDPAVIVWTSGTTGVPKGAWFDHVGLRAAVSTAGVMTAPFDRRLSSTPFAHAGYMTKVWEQVAWGVTLVISPTPWLADDMVRLLADEEITVAGGVPTQWAKVVEHPKLPMADLSSLRMCVSATAPTPPELVQRMTELLGCPVIVRYAMTESPSITGTDPGDSPEVLFRTVGRPQSGVELRLRDDDGRAVAGGEVGRIHLRSAGAMRGYWREPERSEEVLDPDGWIRSGDLGRIDDVGNLVLAGRVDDMYMRGGYNVYPLEVENVLAEHPAVEQAAVIGAGRPVIGEIGVAFVVPPVGVEPPPVDEIKTWCRERLADYKTPDEIVLVDSLPLTPMMKVDRSALRQRSHGSSY